MPIKLSPPADSPEARIEIIPLIDIMFFLLAAFMLVSLSMVNVSSVKVNLPTAVTGSLDRVPDTANLSIDTHGRIFLDRQHMPDAQISAALIRRYHQEPMTRVLISADTDARHGDVVHALDLVRAAGIDRVAFQTSPEPR